MMLVLLLLLLLALPARAILPFNREIEPERDAAFEVSGCIAWGLGSAKHRRARRGREREGEGKKEGKRRVSSGSGGVEGKLCTLHSCKAQQQRTPLPFLFWTTPKRSRELARLALLARGCIRRERGRERDALFLFPSSSIQRRPASTFRRRAADIFDSPSALVSQAAPCSLPLLSHS